MIPNNAPFWLMFFIFVLVFFIACYFEEKTNKKKKKPVKVIEHTPVITKGRKHEKNTNH